MDNLMIIHRVLNSVMKMMSPKNPLFRTALFAVIIVGLCFFGTIWVMKRDYDVMAHQLHAKIVSECETESAAAQAQFNTIVLKSEVVLANIYTSMQMMIKAKASRDTITEFLRERGNVCRKAVELDFTALYGFINGGWQDDGSWTPPADYNPTQRPWYICAVKGKGSTVVVPPYHDSITGKIVVSVVKMLPDGVNVIAIDSYYKDVTVTERQRKNAGRHYFVDHELKVYDNNSCEGRGGDEEWKQAISAQLRQHSFPEKIPSEITINGEHYTVICHKLHQLWWSISLISHKEIASSVTSVLTHHFIVGGSIVALILFIMIFGLNLIGVEQKKAVAANRSKSLFFAMVSHEIRTPLNSIIGFSRILKDCTVDRKTSIEYLNHILSSSQSLSAIINDILELSKLDAGKMDIVLESCDFRTIAHDVMKIFKLKAQETNNVLIAEIDGDFPLLELARPRIQQILFNFVGNAVKFTENGQIVIKASFTKESESTGKLVFSVADTGIGIPAHKLKNILKPFESSNLERNKGGIGLGLPICSKLISRMNGTLDIASAPGKGSTFTVALKNVSISSAKETAAAPERECSSEIPANLQLLLCDDVRLNLKVLSVMLEKKFSAHCVCVESGREALRTLAEGKFDALLTDMWMPEMNGAQLAEKVRSNPATSKLPVFCISADVEAKKNFESVNFNEVLFKPITVESIQKAFIDHGLIKKPV